MADCLDSGWVSSAGPYVDRFEAILGEYTDSCAVATVNGTAALHLALTLCDVAPGDEVLVPSLTFVAAANAVSSCGATPHLVDSDPATLCIDAERLNAYLETIADIDGESCRNRQTGRPIRALVVVHLLGHPANMDALQAICERFGLALVEDAAESLGARWAGRHTGTVGRIGTLSFNGNKTITTGGGGAVLCRDSALAARAKHLSTTARIAAGPGFVHDAVGFNYRLPNINAALGCAQMERLDDALARKRSLAARYREAFKGFAGGVLVAEPAGGRSNWWLNALMLAPEHGGEQAGVIAASNEAGHMTRPAWTPMHRLPIYADCPRAALDGAEAIFSRLVCLPSSASLARRADA